MMYLATRTLVPWWSLKLTNSLQDLEELHWHLQTYGSQCLYLQGLHRSRPDQIPSKPWGPTASSSKGLRRTSEANEVLA